MLCKPINCCMLSPIKHFSTSIVAGVGCRANSECPAKQACQNSKCVNPCVIGACGQNQNCEVANHRAKCINGEYCMALAQPL